MSRHGFSEDCGDDEGADLAMGRWQAQVKSATRGRRGQAFFRALVEALDALPEKSLVSNSLETSDGAVCALGALARHRAIDIKALAIGGDSEEHDDCEWEDSDWDKLASVFDIAPQLAREVMYTNDETWSPQQADPGAARWAYVRRWAARRIIPTEEELAATSEGASSNSGGKPSAAALDELAGLLEKESRA